MSAIRNRYSACANVGRARTARNFATDNLRESHALTLLKRKAG